jgi:hypothetical protein
MSRAVVRLDIEISHAMNKRLEQYTQELNMSNRKIVETALDIWLAQRDTERAK